MRMGAGERQRAGAREGGSVARMQGDAGGAGLVSAHPAATPQTGYDPARSERPHPHPHTPQHRRKIQKARRYPETSFTRGTSDFVTQPDYIGQESHGEPSHAA